MKTVIFIAWMLHEKKEVPLVIGFKTLVVTYHYENMLMQYTERFFLEAQKENFIGKFLTYLIFLLKTYIVCTAEAVLTSTHNVFVRLKIRKLGIPLHTPVLLYKSGV